MDNSYFIKNAVRVAVALLVLAGLSLSGLRSAQRSDKETVVVFNAPFEIPGSHPQVLPAGTYLFRLVDSKSDPHIVQVSNREQSEVYSTILTIPARRDVATNKTEMTFQERAPGQPQALRTWFYPNEKIGEEFLYSGVPLQAAAVVTAPPAAPQTAQAAPPVPTPTVTPRPEVATNNNTVTTANAQARVEPAPAAAPVQAAPQTPPVLVAQNQNDATREASAVPAAPEPATTLPKTASPLPLFAMLGFLSISAGLTLKWTLKNRL